MKLSISDKAHAWYVHELKLGPGEGVRFIGKVYGKTAVHDGMSIGIVKTKEVPRNTAALVVRDGRNYFVTDGDSWFFGEYDLDVQFDDKLEEPKYNFLVDGQEVTDDTTGASGVDGTSGASAHDEP